ncbi:DUF1439 domain-containing protein [Massilia sp. PAMC28688]|uniref:DUF1439 domain-containing protein n=1 Tax=Massilia sp. PAMC28688 TaxID=2861283 RepID=UPI001C632FCC|nr:DUF1439 domain-containing protein [Massilia sp. PAMC28688]QYF95444.1 DUF1439 domain-containing protein [Massilia sp. PAMC28688]
MKKLLKHLVLLALAAGLLTACASVSGPRDIELPLSKLQNTLDRRFPMHNRAFDLFQVELARPRLSVQHHSGRVGIALDASMTPPFMRQVLRGNLALSGRLYIDQARSAVMLAEPVVEGFSITGMEGSAQRDLQRVANLLMSKVMVDVPLYQFQPQDLRYGGVQFVPTGISTTPRGIMVSVAPAR